VRQLAALSDTSFEFAGIPVDVQLTAGSAIHPEHGEDTDELIRRADIALREARADGSAHAVYGGQSERESPDHLMLLADLRKTIREDGLTLYYQPKVEVASGTVAGVEALVRWPHPQRGMVPPNAFIPLAERTGLIKSLTYAVLGGALRQIAQWQRPARRCAWPSTCRRTTCSIRSSSSCSRRCRAASAPTSSCWTWRSPRPR
jgi:predicted signal transduction protein with EAL and GGDEF domain